MCSHTCWTAPEGDFARPGKNLDDFQNSMCFGLDGIRPQVLRRKALMWVFKKSERRYDKNWMHHKVLELKNGLYSARKKSLREKAVSIDLVVLGNFDSPRQPWGWITAWQSSILFLLGSLMNKPDDRQWLSWKSHMLPFPCMLTLCQLPHIIRPQSPD